MLSWSQLSSIRQLHLHSRLLHWYWALRLAWGHLIRGGCRDSIGRIKCKGSFRIRIRLSVSSMRMTRSRRKESWEGLMELRKWKKGNRCYKDLRLITVEALALKDHLIAKRFSPACVSWTFSLIQPTHRSRPFIQSRQWKRECQHLSMEPSSQRTVSRWRYFPLYLPTCLMTTVRSEFWSLDVSVKAYRWSFSAYLTS